MEKIKEDIKLLALEKKREDYYMSKCEDLTGWDKIRCRFFGKFCLCVHTDGIFLKDDSYEFATKIVDFFKEEFEKKTQDLKSTILKKLPEERFLTGMESAHEYGYLIGLNTMLSNIKAIIKDI